MINDKKALQNSLSSSLPKKLSLLNSSTSSCSSGYYWIVDTGGWTVKHGLVYVDVTSSVPTEPNHDESSSSSSSRIHVTPNATGQLPHQITTWIGHDLQTCVKNQSLLRISRPMERGYYTDFQTQIIIWQHILQTTVYRIIKHKPMMKDDDLDACYILNFHPPLSVLEDIQKKTKIKTENTISTLAHSNKLFAPSSSSHHPDTVTQSISTHSSTMILLSKPFVPRCLLQYEDEIWLDNFHFKCLIRRLSASCSAYKYLHTQQHQQQNIDENKSTVSNNNNNNNNYYYYNTPCWISDETGCCCIIESGFSLTHIIPTFQTFAMVCLHIIFLVLFDSICQKREIFFSNLYIYIFVSKAKAIRRINIGGKHLTNLLKEIISYRHWNMMDEFTIVNQVKESLCFFHVQSDGEEEGKYKTMDELLEYARKTKPMIGTRWFDREFVLPDFVHTFQGTVQLPRALIKQQQQQQVNESTTIMKTVVGEEKNTVEKVVEEEKNSLKIKEKKRTKKQKVSNSKNDINDDITSDIKARENGEKREDTKYNMDDDDNHDEEEDMDSEDESEEVIRRRILERKEEEKRMLQLQKEEQQILPMSVERFTVPEILFRPSDAGISQLGLAEAIVQSIQACDPIYHAAMYHNIVLTGGNVLIPHFKERLEVELRSLVPSKYMIRIYLPEDPISYAWDGAKEWIQSGSMTDYACLDRQTWEEMKRQQRDWDSTWKKANTKNMPKDSSFILI